MWWCDDVPSSLAFVKGGCVVMATGHATGLWEVKECASARFKYICRQDKDSAVLPAPPKPHPTPSLSGTCPPDWKSSSTLRNCYKVCVCPCVCLWDGPGLFCAEKKLCFGWTWLKCVGPHYFHIFKLYYVNIVLTGFIYVNIIHIYASSIYCSDLIKFSKIILYKYSMPMHHIIR